MEENETDKVDDVSYYAILNVPEDASEEAIRRSYRHLAQVFHPDKATGSQDDPEAAANFMRIQEAYEVLGNEERRSIYDVYGKEGLHSGLELGEYLRQPDDIRKELERLKAQQKNERREASVAHRGHYIFKVDACDTMDPYDTDVDHMPELISVATTNSVQLPLSDDLAASVGCQVAVKKRVGGGSFVFGVRRMVGKDDVIDCQAAIGLKQFASVDFRHQLGQYTSATVSTSYQPQAGWGLALSSSRSLTQNWDADMLYQVGPESLMSFGLSRRGLKTFVAGKIEVGMSTGFVFKAVWQATASVSLRMSAKLGTMGLELELGGSHRITEFSSTGCAVVAGVQGIVLKPRFSRGGHVFEMPIMLSPSVQDYKLLAAAYILPPAIGFAIRFWVVKPLKKHAKLEKIRAERAEKVKEIESAVRIAHTASKALQGIALRKMRAEAEKNGLVVLNAKYGTPQAIKEVELREIKGEELDDRIPNGQNSHPPTPPSESAHSPTFSVQDSDDEHGPEFQRQCREASRLPPAWLDVTNAVRYSVNDSQLILSKGYSKSGLVGFADIAVGEEKILAIHFLFEGNPFSVAIGDRAGAKIPGAQEQALETEEQYALHRNLIKKENLGPTLFKSKNLGDENTSRRANGQL